VFPPDPTKLAKDLHHFVSIQGNCGASTALTHSPYSFAKKVAALKNIFSSKGLAWPDLQWVAVDDIIAKGKKKKAAAQFPAPLRTDVAFLQYTSGSTSEPKGVMISHGNLAHNEAIIAAELRTTESTICVSWLPQYHDMGLIGSYLGALYCGGSGYYISPISFLKDPVLWVRCMSKFKATHTQAPNFAYALVSRKYKESQQGGKSGSSASMDLSSLQHMINAAEPVDAVAINTFYRTFERFGLPRGVVVPTYGLAEHTVFVCSGGKQQLIVKKEGIEAQYVDVVSENADEYTRSHGGDEKLIESGLLRIVGCGYPKDEYQVSVLIVNAENKSVLGDDKVGEIWVASPSKAMGYWGNETVTVEEFCAKPSRGWGGSSESVAKDEAYGGYLRTGDEGFLHEGELFICGRIKDLIVIRGTNHYPQDIERTVEGKESRLRPGCTAAFSLETKTDV
jgi:acyl-CoA synthetase (AMP-forming)/AMP-acid ligase II